MRRGLSILEAVIALVVLSGATLSVVALFHTGLRRQAHSDDRLQAIAIAQRHLEDLRVRARQTDGFEALAALVGVYHPDEIQPQFEVARQARWATVVSPCTGFYENLPEDRWRELEQTARWVDVVVRWSGPGSLVRLTGYIIEPLRVLADPPKVKVFPLQDIPAFLPPDGRVQLQATLVDRRNLPVEGARFNFWVKPKKAAATLVKLRNGVRVDVINRVAPPSFDGDDKARPAGQAYDAGTTVITARGRYYGIDVQGYSPDIELQAP